LKNIVLTNTDVIGKDNVGALIGKLLTTQQVSPEFDLVLNCSSTGTVDGEDNVGGLIGLAEGPDYDVFDEYDIRAGCINTCYSSAIVTGSGSNIGGLIGQTINIKAYKSHTSGAVTGGNVVGGLIGLASNNALFDFCYTLGDVTGTKVAGGLIGATLGRSLSRKSYAEGDITGTENYTEPEIWNTSVLGIGGLIGYTHFEGIDRCYSLGNVTGYYRVGGLVGAGQGGGYRSPNIASSFCHGNVSGVSQVGGMIGYVFPSYLDFKDMYCTGSVTASSRKGVIIGYRGAPYFPDDPIGKITYQSPAYYNSDVNTAATTNGGEGKTNSELGLESTYEDWLSWSYWVIDQDESLYPILKIFYDPLGITISSIKGTTSQGLICSYIVDGITYYRKYNGSSWDAEVEITDIPDDVDTLNLFKTNDNRIGFITDVDGAMNWVLTEQDSMTIEYTKTLPLGIYGNLIQTIEDVPKLYFINKIQSLSKNDITFSDSWDTIDFGATINMASDSYISRLKAKYFADKTWIAWRSRGQHRIFAQDETADEEEALKLVSGSISIRQDTPVVSVSLEVDSFDRTGEVVPGAPEETIVIGYQEVTPLTEVPEGYTGIYTVTDLLAVTEDMAGNYIQMADIDLTGHGAWTSLVGPPNGLFEGVYDGNGYKIIGLSGEGLFVGTHPTGIIKNVRIIDANIGGMGAIATQYHAGIITNCYVSGNACVSIGNYVSGEISYCTADVNVSSISDYSFGGICSGNYDDSEVKNCCSRGTITGDVLGEIGGLVAHNTGNIHDCYSTCNIVTSSMAGGLIGQSYSDIPIKNCHATGDITVTGYISYGHLYGHAGGLVAHCDTKIEDCYATGKVTCMGQYAGGLVGFLGEEVKRSYALGDVVGGEMTGGFAGFTDILAGNSIEECYAVGNVTGNKVVGGFTASCWDGIITNCYFLGNAKSNGVVDAGVGGFMCYGACQLINCYSAGAVVGSGLDVGGFVGWEYEAWAESGGIITSCYYNSEISGQSDTGKGEPKTTAEMKTQSTFSSWDFNTIWKLSSITDGYPSLQWQTGNNEYIPNYPPASKIKLNFKTGDSDPLLMGIFYIDRTSFMIGMENVNVNARNSIGKYLNDQTFDERNIYPKTTIELLLTQILTDFGINYYYVGSEETELGIEFSPNQSILKGINDVLINIRDWSIKEEADGKVVIAEFTDEAFTQSGTYTFYRNKDVFSRKITKDDNDTYGRVCVHTSDFTIKVYRSVSSNLGWLPPAQKTLYQQAPDGTTSISAALLATEIADRLSNSGEVEEFVGPIRPQLTIGDAAQIIDDDGPNLIGTITSITHIFGKDGFYTQFTVDSGGKINKPLLSDYLKKINSGTITSKIIS